MAASGRRVPQDLLHLSGLPRTPVYKPILSWLPLARYCGISHQSGVERAIFRQVLPGLGVVGGQRVYRSALRKEFNPLPGLDRSPDGLKHRLVLNYAQVDARAKIGMDTCIIVSATGWHVSCTMPSLRRFSQPAWWLKPCRQPGKMIPGKDMGY